MRAACVRFCHCEERSDAAIRVPFGCGPHRRNGERIPTAACARLGMTGSGEWRIVRHPAVNLQAGRHTGRPLPGETDAAQFRICHCEERSDAAIRIPLCAMRDRERENGFPRRPMAASE